MASRLTIRTLHDVIGITPDTPGYGQVFGLRSREALSKRLSNKKAPAITEAQFQVAADRLGVSVKHIKAIRKVEAPRGPYDDLGRPNILFERHKFRNNTDPVGKFNQSSPDLSGPPYGPGGYGSFASQYDKLFKACTLDPEAAFRACSWGAFQVLGENAVSLGYGSALDMALSLVESENAHLETVIRFIEHNKLTDELRACKAKNPKSCVPFVSAYNGLGYAAFSYDKKFATALAE